MATINLKNYTSEVPAITSQGRIDKKLVEAGATDISKKYEDGVCKAVRFRLIIDNDGIPSPMFFELPAKVENCFNVMWAERKQKDATARKRVWEQAERTAWKIVAEWVEIQLSMILMEQADTLQVFLPYAFDPATEQTFYNRLKETKFKLLTNG